MKEVRNINADFEQILVLIQEARNRVYAKANAELVLLYFNVGKVVSQKVEAGNWGENTVQELANFIATKQPELSGFNRRGLYRMKQFYEAYSIKSECFLLWISINDAFVAPLATQMQSVDNKENIKVSAVPTQLQKSKKVSQARTQIEFPAKVSQAGTLFEENEDLHQNFLNTLLLKISWSNHRLILSKTKSNEEKLYYIMTSIKEKYNIEELERALKTATFERTMLSQKQQSISSNIQNLLPQNLFKDPYIFEFLQLPETHSEKDFEKAIIQNLQRFILEVGKGFTYMGNQYRLQVGNKDYYTDLLFYHRDLQCLVLFELKIEDFAPEFLGKLNFYLEALDRDVKRPNENPSIGILLCKGKDTEVVEYAMARNTSPAIIADYETKLIDKKVLANKLHQLAEIFNKEMKNE
jgi:predicted nuclease of restriction endonuclease-like (RecB) superfamily